eukprot:COSAG05_NODE_953_length_6443_cov_14.987390_6_plen_47_part_00
MHQVPICSANACSLGLNAASKSKSEQEGGRDKKKSKALSNKQQRST